MAIICPTITAYSESEYKKQTQRLAHSGHRLHIDLTDGKFTSDATISPTHAWWPVGFKADFHLMFEQPKFAVRELISHKPNLVIIHAEASGDFFEVASFCHQHGVKVGVALLPKTPVMMIESSLPEIDHVLIFSGNLGY